MGAVIPGPQRSLQSTAVDTLCLRAPVKSERRPCLRISHVSRSKWLIVESFSSNCTIYPNIDLCFVAFEGQAQTICGCIDGVAIHHFHCAAVGLTTLPSMSRPLADSRRISSDSHDGQDPNETPSALLTRKRSQERGAAESVAVHEAPQERPETDPDDGREEAAAAARRPYARYMTLLCGFLTSMSFGVTQVPILYVVRLMTCDAYYEEHPPQVPGSNALRPPPDTAASLISNALAPALSYASMGAESTPDRCSVHAIESSIALSISLLGASTTVFGLANLFISGSMIKRFGAKPTLLVNVFFPAIRLFIQNVGLEVWGYPGILIIQCSQAINILGGPSGYVLVLNTFITELVEPEERTAALGRLAGCMMMGAALGFLIGGLVADAFSIQAPFRLTLLLFLSACAFSAVFLPHIPPAEATATDPHSADSRKTAKGAVRRFFGPLFVFAPKKFVRRSGAVSTEYGAFLLACGVFLGILATGPFLLPYTKHLLTAR